MDEHYLPIEQARDALLTTLQATRRLVLGAPPGSGKTTALPLWLTELVSGRVHVVVPRRVLARTAARYVAGKLGEAPGGRVGFATRFESQHSATTRLLYLTGGIQLLQFQQNPDLRGIDAIVFDEAHERRLVEAVIQALVRRLVRSARPDLVIVVASATINTSRFGRYWQAPTMRVEGRAFPIQTYYAPGQTPEDIVAGLIQRPHATIGTGAILVFQPGKAEIQHCVRHLQATLPRGIEIVTLHSEQSPEEQDLAFRPLRGPWRVIVATNIAESGVTPPDLCYVVDTATEKVAEFDPETGVTRLVLRPASQYSITQRCGRAGRVRPGAAYVCASELDVLTRPVEITPEIQRSDLASTLLMLHGMGIHRFAELDVQDAPPQAQIVAADRALGSLNAIRIDGTLTPTGRLMDRLRLPPRIAAALIAGHEQGCGEEMRVLAAMLSTGRRIIPDGSAALGSFRRPEDTSDLAVQLRAFRAIEEGQVGNVSPSEIALRTYEETRAVAEQLTSRRLPRTTTSVMPADALAAALLAGFHHQVLLRREEGWFQLGDSPRPVSVSKESVLSEAAVGSLAVCAVMRAPTARTPLPQATLLSAISLDTLARVLPDRIRVERRQLRYDSYRHKAVIADEVWYWRGEDEIMIGRRLALAPASPAATTELALAIADGRALPDSARVTRERVRLLQEAHRRSMGGIPDLPPGKLATWYVAHLATATSLQESERRSLALSHRQLEELAGVAQLEQRIAAIQAQWPDHVEIGGVCCRAVYEGDTTTRWSVVLVLPHGREVDVARGLQEGEAARWRKARRIVLETAQGTRYDLDAGQERLFQHMAAVTGSSAHRALPTLASELIQVCDLFPGGGLWLAPDLTRSTVDAYWYGAYETYQEACAVTRQYVERWVVAQARAALPRRIARVISDVAVEALVAERLRDVTIDSLSDCLLLRAIVQVVIADITAAIEQQRARRAQARQQLEALQQQLDRCDMATRVSLAPAFDDIRRLLGQAGTQAASLEQAEQVLGQLASRIRALQM